MVKAIVNSPNVKIEYSDDVITAFKIFNQPKRICCSLIDSFSTTWIIYEDKNNKETLITNREGLSEDYDGLDQIIQKLKTNFPELNFEKL